MLVPNAAVGEQNAHVNDVEVRQDVLKATSQAIGQRAHQVSRVVEMTCPAPKSGGHQLAVVLGPIHGHVGALNVLRLLPPDPAVAIGTTEEVLLVVGHSEDEITQQAQHQDPYGMGCAQLDRVVNQIQTLQSIEVRQPNAVSPAQIPSKMIMADINGFQVPGFIPKEVQNINTLKDIDKDHGVCHFTIQLLLFGSKGKVDQSPGHNPRASIEEQLEIKPLPYSRVKFNPHHVVVKEVSSEFAVFGIGREKVAFKHCKRGHCISQDIGTPQERNPVVKNDGR